MTQEFHISVTPVGQDDYLVRTEQVAPGVPLAEELVTWPVADWLAQAGQLMNDPLQLVLRGDAMTGEAVNLVALGGQLYNALFGGTLRDSWITAQGIAQNQQQVLRLRLGLKDTSLARLPWEVMQASDAAGGSVRDFRPLATGPYVAFSRYQSGTAVRGLPSAQMPNLAGDGVRVLMAIASPTDLLRLDLLKQEAIKLQAELQRRFHTRDSQFPKIELTLLEQPGREELTQALEQGHYHVLHYSGHSNLGADGGEIYLVNRRTGLTETLSGDDLAGLLVNNGIQMAVFNSCLGAYTATSDPTGERNLTESLVKRGVKSVLAMAERIPDEVALTLTQLFYRNLSLGYPVDLCVSRMRQGLISAYGSGQMYWALPILYLQPEFDGCLSPEMRSAHKADLLLDDAPLLSTPALYAADGSQMPLPIEEMVVPGYGGASEEVDWLGEDVWDDLVDDIEYEDPSYEDDPSYEADSAIVAGLFRQLDQEKPTDPPETVAQSQSNVAAPPAPPAPPNPPVSPVISTPSKGPNRKLWSLVGASAVGIVLLVSGLLWWQQRQMLANNNDLPPLPPVAVAPLPQPENNKQADITKVGTETITGMATDYLNKGDLNKGLAIATELLNRNVLNNAEQALKLVPPDKAQAPEVQFLWGRLAWQSLQQKQSDNKYSIDDARRYWETAVKAKPEMVMYRNALGFAYYAEGNMNRALDSFSKSLELANQQQADNKAIATVTTSQLDSLTANAGLALVLHKSASTAKLPPDRQAKYRSESKTLRDMIFSTDPVNFLPDRLAQNWLWTEAAIKDWQSLRQEK